MTELAGLVTSMSAPTNQLYFQPPLHPVLHNCTSGFYLVKFSVTTTPQSLPVLALYLASVLSPLSFFFPNTGDPCRGRPIPLVFLNMSQPRLLLLVALPLVMLALSVHANIPCTYQVEGQQVHYDLSKLEIDGDSRPYYQAEDNNPQAKYRYFWNVCDNLKAATFPATFPEDLCADHADPIAAVYQIQNTTTGETPETGICFKLGVANGSKFEAIDHANAAIGITLTYSGGDNNGCPEGVNRSFSISYRCNQFTGDDSEAESISPVVEESPCQYRVSVQSKYGCPTQCRGKEDKVCSDHGICSVDSSLPKKTARCYCNKGYGGSNCATYIPETLRGEASPTPALVGVTITLIVLLLILVVLLVSRIRKLNSGDLSYAKMVDNGPLHSYASATLGSGPAPINNAAAAAGPGASAGGGVMDSHVDLEDAAGATSKSSRTKGGFSALPTDGQDL